jgi:hypothetical protein
MPTGRVGYTKNDDFSIHRGSHPKYNEHVEKQLYKVRYISKAERWSQQRTCEAVTSVMDSYQSQLESGSMSLNRAVDHREPAPAPAPYRAPSPPRETYRAPSPVTYRETYRAPSPPRHDYSQDQQRIYDRAAEQRRCDDERAYQQAQDQRAYNDQCYEREQASYRDDGGVNVDREEIKELLDRDTYTLYLPCDPQFKAQIGKPTLDQFLHEISSIYNIGKELPRLTMSNRDQNENIFVESNMHDTLVGHSFLEADYFMKAFVHRAMYFETKNLEKGFKVAQKCFDNKKGVSNKKDFYAACFLYEGAKNLRRDPFYSKATQQLQDLKPVSMVSRFYPFTDKPESIDPAGYMILPQTKAVYREEISFHQYKLAYQSELEYVHHASGIPSKEVFLQCCPDQTYDPEKKFSLRATTGESPIKKVYFSDLKHMKETIGKGNTDVAYHLNAINIAHCLSSFVQSLSVLDRVPLPASTLSPVEVTARKLPPLHIDPSFYSPEYDHKDYLFGGVSFEPKKITPEIRSPLAFSRQFETDSYIAFEIDTIKVDTPAKIEDWERSMKLATPNPKPRPTPAPEAAPKPRPKPRPKPVAKPVPKPKKKGLFACCGRPD